MSLHTPKYRLHRPTGRAVVTLNGRDIYLGAHNSAASRAEYDRLVSEWLARGRQLPARRGGVLSDLTVNELLVAYLRFADDYYVKAGAPTKEPVNIRLALRPLRRLYGHSAARDFGPLALKAVRAAMLDAGLCRSEINKRVGKVVRLFKRAVSEEMVPPSIHHGLKAVAGLKRGRSEAPEGAPVRPVPDAYVDAIRPHVPRQVWALIELQRLTGMRPGEALQMRTCDLDTSGSVWRYIPGRHKTEHHGRERIVYLGPRAQEIVKPWLRTDLAAYLFCPAEAVAERQAARRAARKSPVQPSQRDRKKARPKKAPGVCYTPDSYRACIQYACRKAKVPGWHPHQLRHNAATKLRREYGLDVARAILGHSGATTTQIYAELDQTKALAVMAEVG